MQEMTACPICKSTAIKNFYSCLDYTVSKEKFNIIKCLNCGLAITNPRPSEEILDNYYLSDNYISHSDSRPKSIIEHLYVLVRKFTLKQKVRLISSYNATASILDYGCGTGEFLNVCKSNGWKINGVESSSKARTKAITLTTTEIHSSLKDVPNEKIEVITLWHVLEHIPNFNVLIKQLSNRLSDNGTIFIAVPNYESYDAEIYKEYWAGYDVPRHLWHFSKFSLEKLFNDNSLKLKSIVPMKFDSFYVSLLSEKYKNNNTYSIIVFIKAFLTGIKSNLKAKKTGNYSSLIYIVQK